MEADLGLVSETAVDAVQPIGASRGASGDRQELLRPRLASESDALYVFVAPGRKEAPDTEERDTLLVSQRLDRVELGRAAGWKIAEDHPDGRRKQERE
jgi:hypothetical protein